MGLRFYVFFRGFPSRLAAMSGRAGRRVMPSPQVNITTPVSSRKTAPEKCHVLRDTPYEKSDFFGNERNIVMLAWGDECGFHGDSGRRAIGIHVAADFHLSR